MNYTHNLIFYRTITPLHVGCGQAVGVVDLPVIRERATGYPFIPGSSIRGSLRRTFKRKDPDLTGTLFGPESDTEIDRAGCIALHDARVLFYPVRADRRVFVWVTCPLVLQRFSRDTEVFGASYNECEQTLLNSIAEQESKFIGTPDLGERIHLEEFCFERLQSEGIEHVKLAEFGTQFDTVIPKLDSRLVLVSNSSFYHFVTHATMLIQHNTLDAAKTVKDGHLFSIESIPPEALFYGNVGATKERGNPNGAGGESLMTDPEVVLDKFKSVLFGDSAAAGSGTAGAPVKPKYLHLGGRESTGLGVTELHWA